MALKDDIASKIDGTFRMTWDSRDGTVVPTSDTVKLAGGVVELEATFLYADLRDSARLVREHPRLVSAKILRAFIASTVMVIRANGGQVRSFDGDRVLGVFVGGSKNSNAAKSALKINHVVTKTLRPKAEAYFKAIQNSGFEIKHGVGVDTGPTSVVRAGVRDHNDLIWVSDAANFAAKLSDLKESPHHTYITREVFAKLSDEAKMGGDPKRLMWEERQWKVHGTTRLLNRSSWHWSP